MVVFDFPKYGVHYEERGNFKGYIALVDMDEFYDIRTALAKSPEEATTDIEKMGGKVTALFTIAEAMETINRNMKPSTKDVPLVVPIFPGKTELPS